MTFDAPINENAIRRTARRGILLKSRTTEGILAGILTVVLATGAAIAAYAGSQSAPATTAAGPVSDADELRLGYFGNVTHAPALVGLEQAFFEEELGTTRLSTQVFNAGPAAIEALNAGAIDAAFIGPNPAINSFVQSRGESLRIVAGATSGGAQLVVRPGITTPADLAGRALATPQLGNTQDVALRVWLQDEGYATGTDGSGDVAITPTENALSLQLFRSGEIDGAWLPEPWASRAVLEAGATVLVDEKDLWPNGEFATTLLIVSKKYLAEHPAQVESLIRGEQRAIDWIENNPEKTPDVINAGLETANAKPLPGEIISRSLDNITFTLDPHARALAQLLEDGVAAGTTGDSDITGILDLSVLNRVRSGSGLDPVSTSGLGSE